MTYSKYIGVTGTTAALIEGLRNTTEESEDDILRRALSQLHVSANAPANPSTAKSNGRPGTLDLGQGVRVQFGERLYLFLDKGSEEARVPQGMAEVKHGGLYVDGRRVVPSHGSLIQPAMRHFQEKLGHRNAKGEFISLSAYRQWYVRRGERLASLETLKDPALARTRRRGVSAVTLEDLGLA